MQLVARVLIVVVLAVVPLGAAPAPDGTVPSAETLFARVHAAEGATPQAFRETRVTTYADGATTIERYFERGHNWRASFDIGPLHSEDGDVDGQSWRQNENGQTIDGPIDREPAELSPSETPKPTAVVSTRPDGPGYRITDLDAQRQGVIVDVDGAPHIVRVQRYTANGIIDTSYDDFRTVGGRTIAYHEHAVDAYEHRTSDTRITEYTPTATAGDVAQTPPLRRLVEFPAGVNRVVLPTTFIDKEIILRVNVGARGLDLVLDTGASGIALDQNVAKQLGLARYDARTMVSAARHAIARSVIPEMRVGPLSMNNVAVTLIPHSDDVDTRMTEVGLIGFDFLAELGLTIDYEHQTVTAVPGDQYEPPAGPQTFALDVNLEDGSPLVPVTINGARGSDWTLDTGANGGLLIFPRFARRHPEAIVDLNNRGAKVYGTQMYGVGGAFDVQPYRIATLDLASAVRFTDFLGYRVVSASAYEGYGDGLIGTDFLSLFSVGLDYSHGRVYLTPDSRTRRILQPTHS